MRIGNREWRVHRSFGRDGRREQARGEIGLNFGFNNLDKFKARLFKRLNANANIVSEVSLRSPSEAYKIGQCLNAARFMMRYYRSLHFK